MSVLAFCIRRGWLATFVLSKIINSNMPVLVPVALASLTWLCVYEVEFRWSVDFRGGSIGLTWRLKRVVEPEF